MKAVRKYQKGGKVNYPAKKGETTPMWNGATPASGESWGGKMPGQNKKPAQKPTPPKGATNYPVKKGQTIPTWDGSTRSTTGATNYKRGNRS